MRRFYCALFFILLSQLACAFTDNTLTFTQISTREGLSQNTVRCIIADRKGFIWAGTVDGINRYDGNQLIAYKPQIGNANSLPDHRIKDVFEDNEGYLWIKSYDNTFSCYDPELERFVPYHDYKYNVRPEYTDYYKANGGDIWLWGNTDGCVCVKRVDDKLVTNYFSTLSHNKLASNDIAFLFEDSQSAVWIGSSIGLCRVNKDHKTELFYNNIKFGSFLKAVELKGKIYFITNTCTIYIYDLKKNSFLPPIKTGYANSDERFKNLALLENDRLLITTLKSGLLTFDPKTNDLSTCTWSDKDQFNSNLQLIRDKDQNIWVYNHTGIVWYHNIQNGKTKRFELIPPDIAKMIDFERYNVYVDSKGMIWITTYGNGLFSYNPDNDILTNYKYSIRENSIASDYLLSITEDHMGNIWIGSEYAGIIKVVRQGYSTNLLRPEPEMSIGKSNNLKTILEDSKSNVWLGTKNGSLYRYDSTLKKEIGVWKGLNPYSIIEDHNKRIWVGTKGNGVYLFNDKAQQIGHFMNNASDSQTLSHNTIFHMMEDNAGRVWIGSFAGGLNLVDETSKGIKFRRFFAEEGNRSYIRYLLQDRKGVVWMCTSDGVICFHPEELMKNKYAYKSFKFNISAANSLSCNDVKVAFEDQTGDIWIGTAGGGVNKYIPAANGVLEHFVSYTTQDGLSGDMISGILEDSLGYLWISTENGMTKFDKNNNTAMTFHFSGKTAGDHFNENSCYLRDKGDMLWGTMDGLISFNPLYFTTNSITPPVLFTNFFLYDDKVEIGSEKSPLKKSITYSQEIELAYDQNTFTLEFATLTLKEPKKNKYTYFLENYDRQWSVGTNANRATYKNLNPGKYTFKVRAANSEGVWSDTTELLITVRPPFWRSGIAYLFYFTLLVGILYFVYRIVYKFNALNNAVEVEKQLTGYKLQFFTNISHEFRTPLTLIRGAVENLNEQRDLLEITKKQINILSRNSNNMTKLIDQLLEFRKLENNIITLNLENTNIVEFSREIYTGFSEMALQKQIDYTFSSDVEILDLFIDRGKVDKILYNLLSNSFKYTPRGGAIELRISINNETNKCVLSVRDNGIGIPKEKQHLLFSRFMQINFSASGTGVGLSLVKEFVEVHKGRVWYEDGEGDVGSVFSVELSTLKSTYEGENFLDLPAQPIDIADQNIIATTSAEMSDSKLHEIDFDSMTGCRILVIDDNIDIREFLKDELGKYFHVDFADNGVEGLKKAIDSDPDLIICDVMMPEMDGFEVTRRLKNEFQSCHIPIILLTAHSSLEHQMEGINSGADAYIMKPFSFKYLLTRTCKLIEQRDKLRQRFSSDNQFEGRMLCSNDKDKEFYDMINKILDENISNSAFNVDDFAELVNLRRTVFYKKVKGIMGCSPNELLKVKRMHKAAELLISGEFTVSEISYKVGIEDPFYFSKCFKAQFGCSPSKYKLN